MFRRHVINRLSYYIDGKLKEKEKLAIDQHLKLCQFCRKELIDLELVRKSVKNWTAPKLDEGFDDRLMNAIVERELNKEAVPMKRKTLAMLIPSGVVAGLLVLVMFNQVYMKKSVTARLKTSSEEIGENYAEEGFDAGYDITNGMQFLNGKKEKYHDAWGVSRESDYRHSKFVSAQSLKLEDSDFDSNIVDNRIKSVKIVESPVENQGSVIVIQPVLPGTPDAEKLIRTATISLEIEDGTVAYKKVADICKEFNGYLAASRFFKDDQGRQAGTITMRIPKDKFDAALESLSAIGKVEDVKTDSQDVSRQYASLKTELDATMVVYNKMLEALNKRQATIPEVIRMESELTPVLRKVEHIKNQIETLNNAVSFTTIKVNFHETKVSVKTLRESTKSLRESLIATGINSVKFIAYALPFVFAILVLVFCSIVAAVVIKNIIKKLFKRD